MHHLKALHLKAFHLHIAPLHHRPSLRALQVWDDAMAANCQTDCRMSTTLIEVCARKGDTLRALRMYDQMRQAPADSRMAPSVHAYTAAMRAAAEGGAWEAALSIWDDMKRANCRPTGQH